MYVCGEIGVCVPVCVEVRGQCKVSSPIALTLVFEAGSLTKPGTHQSGRLTGR